MSKTGLWIVIGIAAFVVVALAALTPTVIVDHHDGARVARVSAPAPGPLRAPGPAPFPLRRGLLPDLRNLRQCFEQHGFGGPERKLPTPNQFRGAFRDCAPRLR